MHLQGGLNIAFIHPDLGIGGAERLVVDAALALKKRNHHVRIFTSHHDRNHCFRETINGDLDIVAVGDWLPRHIFGRCYALCAYIRMIYVAIYLSLFSAYQYDVVFCDQISACIPIFRCCGRHCKIVFYCHYPDQLLTQRKTFLKSMYRAPIDWFEEKTTGQADCVLVNSKFTASVYLKTFTTLRYHPPTVLYPSVNFESFTPLSNESIDLSLPKAKMLFLSINRYEKKKNLALALHALICLRDMISSDQWSNVHLVMAGGYDNRVEENRVYYQELQSIAQANNLTDHVTFKKSVSDTEKMLLLQSCTCLLYTPTNEHFGIVPIEAMYMNRPVIACNSGGPLETIKFQVTGLWCDPEAKAFADAMKSFVDDPKLAKIYGDAGRKHVMSQFSFDHFADELNRIVCNIAED